jgi:hypothetical protein
MRTPVMIAIAAVAGFALAWLLLTRVPQPPVPAVRPAPAAPVSQPARVAATAPVAPAPQPSPVEPKPAPPPVAVEPPKPAGGATKEVAAATDAAADAAATESEPAVEEEVPAAEEEDTGPPEIDADHAADLLADLIARQEAAANENEAAAGTAQTWQTFDKEQADPAWSEPTTAQIEAALDQWLSALPEEIQAHIAVVHVECRVTLCQILAADNDVETQNERAQAGQEWQQAIALLPSQAWWNELGFVDLSTQVVTTDEHTLYMTYLRREVKPPAE